jgi:hypothetical protein
MAFEVLDGGFGVLYERVGEQSAVVVGVLRGCELEELGCARAGVLALRRRVWGQIVDAIGPVVEHGDTMMGSTSSGMRCHATSTRAAVSERICMTTGSARCGAFLSRLPNRASSNLNPIWT